MKVRRTADLEFLDAQNPDWAEKLVEDTDRVGTLPGEEWRVLAERQFTDEEVSRLYATTAP